MNFKKFSAGLLIALMSGALSSGVAFADEVFNNVDNTVDATVEVLNLTVGQSGNVNLKVSPANGDGENGCNLDSGESLVATVNNSASSFASVTSASSVTFSGPGCGDSQVVSVTALAAGETTISLTQTSNTAGSSFNLAPATFKVIVSAAPVIIIDTTAPTLSLPSDMTVEATSASGATATFSATATDVSPANPAVICTPASGATFPLGATLVNCSATDAANNTATGSFTVTVVDTTAPTLPVHVSPANNTFTTTALQQLIDWTDSTDAVSAVTYMYESSYYADVNGNGAFTTAASGPAPVAASEIATGGTPEGVYYWHVKAVDAAANESAWTDAWKITVDNTAPTISIVTPTVASYSLNQVVNASYTCSDALSGVASCVGTVANGATLDTSIAGLKTFTVTATDNSGNVTVQNVQYSVGYNSATFVAGAPVTLTSKEFKQNSTIPVKFTIKDFLGNPYALANATLQICKVGGSCAAPIASGGSNTGSAFRYDVSGGQYIYNLSTKSLPTTGQYTLKITIDGNLQTPSSTITIK